MLHRAVRFRRASYARPAGVPETTAVGQAAASWRLTREDQDEVYSSLDALLEYVGCYKAANGQLFSDPERAAALASGLWLLAYTARCEYAMDPEGHSALPQLRQDEDRFRTFLHPFQ